MPRYEKMLNMLMDFNESIIFAAVSNTCGKILWHSKRDDIELKITLPEIKKALVQEGAAWIQRCKAEEKNDVGRAMYSLASFEKVKQITIPIDAFHLLYIIVNNKPLKKTKTKSYGRLVEMGRIMSIVDFVNTFE